MNDSEKSVYEYLMGQGFGTVVYEPDGKVPPDFLVNGRIAVEVRRLNQKEETATGHRGLEEVSKPLRSLAGNDPQPIINPRPASTVESQFSSVPRAVVILFGS